MITLERITDISLLMLWRTEVIEHVFGCKPSAELLDANRRYYHKNIANGSHIALLAKVDDVEAGCGSICLTEELPSPDNLSGRCAYLMNIYVRETFREHGVGHAVVERLIEIAREHSCGKIYLETTLQGRYLYESLGFHDLPDMMKLKTENTLS